MAADVISTYSSLQAELEQARGGLHKLDENLKKIIQTSGRYKQDRHAQGPVNKQNNPNVFPNARRLNENNNSFNNNLFNNNAFNNRKRPNETKTVFSRLSRKVTGDSDAEDETNQQNIKNRISSQVTRTLPTKQEVLRAQLNADPGNKKDNAEVCRARRVFGSLLGTLRAFCKEEALARDKDVFARRVSLEQKIECKASVEAAEMANQRRNLIQQREQQIHRIKAIEIQMHRVQCHEVWEKAQKHLSGFIKTSAKSHLYWSPAKHNDKSKQLLLASQHQLRRIIDKRRRELESDLEVINNKLVPKEKPVIKEEKKDPTEVIADVETDRRNIVGEEEPVKMEVEEDKKTEEIETNEKTEETNDDQQMENTEQISSKESGDENREPELADSAAIAE